MLKIKDIFPIITIILISNTYFLFSEDTVQEVRPPVYLSDEAPGTLYSTELGSAEVDLTLEGSWTASLSQSFGLISIPVKNYTASSAFPLFDYGFSFRQALRIPWFHSCS